MAEKVSPPSPMPDHASIPLGSVHPLLGDAAPWFMGKTKTDIEKELKPKSIVELKEIAAEHAYELLSNRLVTSDRASFREVCLHCYAKLYACTEQMIAKCVPHTTGAMRRPACRSRWRRIRVR